MNSRHIKFSGTSTQEEIFQRGLEKIRTSFICTLPQKLAEVERFMGLIETDTNALDGLNGLSEIAHKFRGTAMTLGFSQLGKASGKLEDSIADIRNARHEPVTMAQIFLESYSRFVKEILALS